MSVEENKANQMRVWEEIYNRGDFSIVPDLFDVNWVEHTPMGDLIGREAFTEGTRSVRTAFPDVHVTVNDIFGEGDKVVSRITLTGTLTGEYMGYSPTGKKLNMAAILITQWRDGKEVEAWRENDTSSVFKQIGIPAPG